MSRTYTQILKGIAFLMMLLVHINFTRTSNFIFLCNGKTLGGWLQDVSTPVTFFLMLGGYGLYCIHLKGKDKNRFKRILRLYVHFWIILSIFILIYLFSSSNPEHYSFNIKDIIYNYSSFHVSWNIECQFILPYSCLSILYPVLFRQLDQRPIIVLFFSLLFYLISGFCFSKFTDVIYNNPFYDFPAKFLFFQLPFFLGACLKKYVVIERLFYFRQRSVWNKFLLFVALLSVILLKSISNRAYVCPMYAICFIALFPMIKMPKIVNSVLMRIGDHSMNMWMIHTWFCFHLYKDWLYSFEYSFIIIPLLLGISYICSEIVNYIIRLFSPFMIVK